MSRNRLILVPAILILILLAAVAGYELLKPRHLHGEVIEPPHPVSNFTLHSASGPVSLSDFRGKIVVLYFGYTSCPDLCPITLATLHQALESLGKKAADVQVIFVSVDWKRYTKEVMAKYVSHFDASFIGLSGAQQEIDSITQQLGIFYLLNLPDENGFYSVDHTASTRVLDRQGRLKLIWPYDLPPAEITSDLQVLLRSPASTP